MERKMKVGNYGFQMDGIETNNYKGPIDIMGPFCYNGCYTIKR